MPLLLLLLLAVSSGALAGWLVLRRAHRVLGFGRPVVEAGARAGAVAARRGPRRVAALLRVDPKAGTGVGLAVALVVLAVGGAILGILALLVRSDSALVRIDASVSRWADRHDTPLTTDVLEAVTHVGAPTTVVVLAVVLAVIEVVRSRGLRVVPFLALVVGGNAILTTTVKELADRVRPELNPVAATLGPSFPSGHSSWTAALVAAAVLVLGRGRPAPVRAALAASGVALVVTIAGSRVLLGVHWLSDVLAGLTLGTAWFAACAVAFGGRLLRFGSEVEVAARSAARAA